MANYVKGKVLSIEIGAIYTRLCLMKCTKNRRKIKKCLIVATPDNTYEDGYVRDRKAFVEYLKERMIVGKIRCKDVVFTISSNKILSREVILPNVKEKLIHQVIRSEADEYFPMDITDHTLTYAILERMQEEKQKMLRVMVYAAPENLIKNYQNLADEMKWDIVSLDYAGNSVYQQLKKDDKKDDKNEHKFILQVNDTNSIVTVLNNGAMAIQRTINHGVAALADVAVEGAEYKADKLSEGIALLKEEMLLGEETFKDACTNLINTISRIIEYYTSKNKDAEIKEVFLTGQGATVRGLPELLANELGIRVSLMNPQAQLRFKRKAKTYKDQAYEWINCVGAILNSVNFVSMQSLLDEQRRSSGVVAFLMILLALSAATALVMLPYYEYEDIRQENERLIAEHESLIYINAIYDDYVRSTEANNSVTAFHQGTFSYLEAFNEIIRELEDKMPLASIVHSVSFSEQSFTMSMSVMDKTTAAKVIEQLKMIPYIGLVSISGISETRSDDTGTAEVVFTVTCTYATP